MSTQSDARPSESSAPADGVYDVIVLGAGPVGQTVAARTRSAGLSVVLVERELVGGECSYWGCVPSKALLRPVLAIADARRIDGAREAISDKIDVAGVFGRRDRYVTNWHDVGQANTVAEEGVELIRGHARLDGTRRVRVVSADQRVNQLTARHAVVICTGSTAAVPDIPGIVEANPWTNRKGTDSSTVPTRLAVVGGGGVGVEMATAWQGLGSQVTLLARTSRLLPRMEPFVGEFVARGLFDAGVDVRAGVNVTELQRRADSGAVDVTLDCGDHVVVDEILFATGRTPNTKISESRRLA